VGENSYCDEINDDNKSQKCFSYHIYLLGVKCDICRDLTEEQVGSEKHYVGPYVGWSPSCTCGMCYAGCCPCGGSAEDKERAVGENSYCDEINDDNKSQKCFSYHIYLLGVKCDICRDMEGARFSHEKAVGRMYNYEESEMCMEGCVKRNPSDYERCKNFCVESELEKEKAVGRMYKWEESEMCIEECGRRDPNDYERCKNFCVESELEKEKAVARGDRYDEEEMCIRECGRRDPNDYERCKNSCVRVRDYGRQERAVGGSWENGKCMSYGSYLADAGATVNDMGTGWSESSCQSECDYSSTTKACQYEFSSQRCLMIGFYTNEIYGAGDYDAVCYVK